MKDTVITFKKIETLVKRELKKEFMWVSPKDTTFIAKSVNNILKDRVKDLMDEIPTHVGDFVKSNYSVGQVVSTGEMHLGRKKKVK